MDSGILKESGQVYPDVFKQKEHLWNRSLIEPIFLRDPEDQRANIPVQRLPLPLDLGPWTMNPSLTRFSVNKSIF